MSEWKMTIGIECHVQLATKTKLFSTANNDSRSATPNSQIHEIDFGLPGMLPRLNKQAVVLAVKAGKALNAEVAQISRFDRKHYFYPDLPKGYQATQMYQPIILAGYVDVPLVNGDMKRVRVHHAHMEEDAGKLTHHQAYSLVDLNRAGTPLIEIVSEPDMHTPEEARSYATELYRLMTYAGVTFGDLYNGNMRFDVNISMAHPDAQELGTRAEIKNLNSFRSIEKAAEYEAKRQIQLLDDGGTVVQETRGWDEAKQKTISQRSKADAQDYRYMPDADIPPIVLSQEEITKMQGDVPKLPNEYRHEFSTLGLDKSVVNTVLSEQAYAEMVSEVLAQDAAAAKRVANWVASNLDSPDKDSVEDAPIASLDDLLELSKMVDESKLSSNAASELFNDLMNGMTDPRKIAETKNILQVSDESEISSIVDEIIADPASKKALDDIKAGNDKAIGYLVGQVMKKSQGKANPELAQKLIKERL